MYNVDVDKLSKAQKLDYNNQVNALKNTGLTAAEVTAEISRRIQAHIEREQRKAYRKVMSEEKQRAWAMKNNAPSTVGGPGVHYHRQAAGTIGQVAADTSELYDMKNYNRAYRRNLAVAHRRSRRILLGAGTVNYV